MGPAPFSVAYQTGPNSHQQVSSSPRPSLVTNITSDFQNAPLQRCAYSTGSRASDAAAAAVSAAVSAARSESGNAQNGDSSRYGKFWVDSFAAGGTTSLTPSSGNAGTMYSGFYSSFQRQTSSATSSILQQTTRTVSSNGPAQFSYVGYTSSRSTTPLSGAFPSSSAIGVFLYSFVHKLTDLPGVFLYFFVWRHKDLSGIFLYYFIWLFEVLLGVFLYFIICILKDLSRFSRPNFFHGHLL
ncbi:hypothetical protein NA56DRAFT_706193 [Hyaloscypha hepaticicola]|uniref:Uncharacterized protein n=1 Tax=Hyaloscypha hepaticicola TaxID=2082293 RepID=A0A2J6PYM1_9HELO|nr:hypothetical protein NA56DRAFT_706193 [Hyaloscypha hepaticicola]